MTGISDNHGWGYATAVWNAVRLPGWFRVAVLKVALRFRHGEAELRGRVLRAARGAEAGGGP